MQVIVMILLMLISSILPRSVFPVPKAGLRYGQISLRPEMRPLKNSKEFYENYLRNNPVPYRKSLQQIKANPLVIIQSKDKNSFEDLKSIIMFLLNESKTNGNRQYQKIDNDRKKVQNHRGKSLRSTKLAQKQEQHIKKQEMNIFDTSSSDEFNSREEAIFVNWQKKKYCNSMNATPIPKITYQPEAVALLPKNFYKIDKKLTETVLEKSWRPGWPRQPLKEYLQSIQRMRPDDLTPPPSVFQFDNLVV